MINILAFGSCRVKDSIKYFGGKDKYKFNFINFTNHSIKESLFIIKYAFGLISLEELKNSMMFFEKSNMSKLNSFTEEYKEKIKKYIEECNILLIENATIKVDRNTKDTLPLKYFKDTIDEIYKMCKKKIVIITHLNTVYNERLSLVKNRLILDLYFLNISTKNKDYYVIFPREIVKDNKNLDDIKDIMVKKQNGTLDLNHYNMKGLEKYYNLMKKKLDEIFR